MEFHPVVAPTAAPTPAPSRFQLAASAPIVQWMGRPTTSPLLGPMAGTMEASPGMRPLLPETSPLFTPQPSPLFFPRGPPSGAIPPFGPVPVGGGAPVWVLSDDEVMDNTVVGLPRVLGVPVALAEMPLQDNCCDLMCSQVRCVKAMDRQDRSNAVIFSWFAAGMVLALFLLGDALGSHLAIHNAWSGVQPIWPAPADFGHYPDPIEDGYARGVPPNFLVNSCQLVGKEPDGRVQISLAVLLLSSVSAMLLSITLLVGARGCILCCAPCALCDKAFQVGGLMGGAVLALTTMVGVTAWLVFALLNDLNACQSCLEENLDRFQCAQRFVLYHHPTGLASGAGLAACVAVLLSGRYAFEVPAAIQGALRFKAHRLANMQRRLLLQSVLPTLDVSPVPEALAFLTLNNSMGPTPSTEFQQLASVA